MEKRKLRALIEEFNDQRAKTSNNGHRQALKKLVILLILLMSGGAKTRIKEEVI